VALTAALRRSAACSTRGRSSGCPTTSTTGRPILHEPGADGHALLPVAHGIAIRSGEKIRLTGAYDSSVPHPRVMSIMHVYLARDTSRRRAARRCPATSAICRRRQRVRPSRRSSGCRSTGVNDQGHVFEILDAPWPLQPRAERRDGGPARQPFSADHIALPVGGA
jgi:hypothetical protein